MLIKLDRRSSLDKINRYTDSTGIRAKMLHRTDNSLDALFLHERNNNIIYNIHRYDMLKMCKSSIL